MTKANFELLFKPKSIAIYGVSKDTNKIGFTIFSNLLASQFPGKIYPINPKYGELFGYKCFPNAVAVPEVVDLAIMAIPAQFALEVIADCAAKHVPNLVIISAGFKEVGPEGKALEDEVYKRAAEAGINVLGPNCLGLIVAQSKMNASFAANVIYPGNIAFGSQSGAVCSALLDMAGDSGLGFSDFVSLGNKGSINENDLLEIWLNSEAIKVIGLYLEEFVDGLDFVSSKVRLGKEKPIVVLNPGTSEAARSAMSSHTGSLAGSTAVIDAALAKNGISQVDTVSQAYNLLMAYSWLPLPAGKRVGIVTNAGGPGIIASDIVSAAGLEVAKLSSETEAALSTGLPATANIHNPVDIVGDAPAARYFHGLSVLLNSQDVDAILLILTPQLVTEIEDTAKLIVTLSKQSSKPIFPVFMGARYVQGGARRLLDNKLPVFTDIDDAVIALKHMHNYTKYLADKAKVSSLESFKQERRQQRLSEGELFAALAVDQLVPLSEAKVQELLTEFGIPFPASTVADNADAAVSFWQNLSQNLSQPGSQGASQPIVIKATTKDIVHKTEFKAIYTNINSEQELRDKFATLQAALREHTHKEQPQILLQQQVKAEEELFIGLKRDGASNVYNSEGRGFGHILLFGKGGIYTEVYQDIAKDLLPLSEEQLQNLISQTKVSQIIDGARGLKPLPRNALVDVLTKLQKLVITYPELAEIDINPVMLTASECLVVDAKLFVRG